MKRTGFKPRSTPMRRTGIKARAAFLRPARPKATPIRQAARGQACTLELPGCCHDPATVVWCHSNRSQDGKGMGIKARDEEGCFGCFHCHNILDGRTPRPDGWSRDDVEAAFDRARRRSQAILRRLGLLP